LNDLKNAGNRLATHFQQREDEMVLMQLVDPNELATLDVRQLDALIAAVNAEMLGNAAVKKHLEDKAKDALKILKAQPPQP